MKNRSYFDHLILIFYDLFFAAPKERQPKREVKRVEKEENNNERNSRNKVKGWIILVVHWHPSKFFPAFCLEKTLYRYDH